MAEKLEIIFDTADRFPGRISFDVSFRGNRYVDHRNAGTPEAAKIAHDIKITAERNGFRYVPGAEGDPIRRFVSISPEAAANPRAIVDAFRDQGCDVAVRGHYHAGKVLTWDEFTALDCRDHARGQREEAAYAAGRAAERAGQSAVAILRLKAAALAEEAPETAQMEQADRNAFRARQAAIREQENAPEMPEQDQIRAFAA